MNNVAIERPDHNTGQDKLNFETQTGPKAREKGFLKHIL